jgi:molybdopterin/thiamine biosynthesis adenylyltransferase
MTLTADERARYDRHLIIPELGEEGQEALKRAGVLVVGAGGLGSPALLYLAAAGVGRLGIVDHDVVELSNLNRQTLHATADVGRPKTESAAEKLHALNPEVRLELHQVAFTADTAAELVARYDVVITAVDDFASRFLLNDACVLGRKTLVEGAILRFVGLAMTIKGGESACYRCLFPERPAEGALPGGGQAGVFGPVPGVIGAVQAIEAIKVICGFGAPLYNRLLQFDAIDLTFQETPIARDPDCPVCGANATIKDLRRSVPPD